MDSLNPIPYYQIVPRFDVSPKDGPLQLGMILSDLRGVRALNRNHHVKVPKDLMFSPKVQTNCDASLDRTRSLNPSAWLEAFGGKVEGKVIPEGTATINRIITCKSIETHSFDIGPTADYFRQSIEVAPVRDFIQEKGSVDLYLVTGVKYSQGLHYSNVTTLVSKFNIEAKMAEPITGVTNIGAKVGANHHAKSSESFDVDDVVLAYRVQKFNCYTSWFSDELNFTDKGYLKGSLMTVGDDKEEPEEDENVPEDYVGDQYGSDQYDIDESESEFNMVFQHKPMEWGESALEKALEDEDGVYLLPPVV